MDTCEVNPYSMLEVTLTEDNPTEVQAESLLNPETNSIPDSDYTLGSNCYDKLHENSKKLGTVSNDEMKYRLRVYQNLEGVLLKRLHCTVCDAHIGCSASLNVENIAHPLLGVLMCVNCTAIYRSVEFISIDTVKDYRCRWCGSCASKDRLLRFCAQCPFAFCEKCILKNLPLQKCVVNWTCCVCNLTLLWPERALLWALFTYFYKKKIEKPGGWIGDLSQCCKINYALQYVLPKINNELVNGTNIGANAAVKRVLTLKPLIPLDKLVVETTWIRQKLYLISLSLGKIQELVHGTTAELSSYGRADVVKQTVEHAATTIAAKAEQIVATCNLLKSDFIRNLNDARIMATNKKLEVPKNENNNDSIPELTSLQNAQNLSEFMSDETLNVSDSENKNIKSPRKSTKQTTTSTDRRKALTNNKKKRSIKRTRKSRKNLTKNLYRTSSSIDWDSITEFNGIPIKKCFIKLHRLSQEEIEKWC